MTQTVLFIGGGARGNPGPAAAGVVLQTPAGEPVAEDCIYLGRMTNSAAEFHALIRGLQVAGQRGIRDIVIRTDNELLVRQVKGEVPLRDPSVSTLHQLAGQLLRSYQKWVIEHVPKAQNGRAEKLVQQMLDRKDGAIRVQPPSLPIPGATPTIIGATSEGSGIKLTPASASRSGPAVPATSMPFAVSNQPLPPASAAPPPNIAQANIAQSNVPQAASSGMVAAVRAEVLKARPRLPGGQCDLAVGRVFEFGRTSPAGVPLLVLAGLLPYIVALQRGAGFEFSDAAGLQLSCSSDSGYYLIGLRRIEDHMG